jgi:hypothetical protein
LSRSSERLFFAQELAFRPLLLVVLPLDFQYQHFSVNISLANRCPLKRLNEMQETLGPKTPMNQAATVTCPICGALVGFRCVDHTGQICFLRR